MSLSPAPSWGGGGGGGGGPRPPPPPPPPPPTALSQEAGRRSAGTAAALQGGLGFLTGAVVSPLTGILGYDTLMPMATAMMTFYVLGFVLLLVVVARARRQGTGTAANSS